MRNFLNLRCFVILFYLLCTACGTALPSVKPFKLDVQQGNVVTSKMLLQLRPGMTKSQVRFIMGSPLIQDSFHGNRWDYAYQLRENGKLKEQRRVILDFENEVLKTVRGDVVPAGSEAAKALQAEADAAAAVVVKKEEEKSMVDKLKFWDKDEKAKATATESAKTAEPKKVGGEIVNSQVAAPAALLANQADANVGAVIAPPQSAVTSDAAAIPEGTVGDVATAANDAKTNDTPSILAVPLVAEPLVAESLVAEPLAAEATPNADSAPVAASVPNAEQIIEPEASPATSSNNIANEAAAVAAMPPLASNPDAGNSDSSNPDTGSQESLPVGNSTYHSEAGMLFDRTLKMTPLDPATIAAQMAADEAASASQSSSDIPAPKPLPAEAEPGLFDRMLERIGF